MAGSLRKATAGLSSVSPGVFILKAEAEDGGNWGCQGRREPRDSLPQVLFFAYRQAIIASLVRPAIGRGLDCLCPEDTGHRTLL